MDTRQITHAERLELVTYTQPQEVSHWGQKSTVTPVLIDTVFGDGKKLLRFAPLNTRPNYYLILIDSSYDELDSEGLYALFPAGEEIDPIYRAISEQFDSVARVTNDDKEYSDCKRCRESKEEYPCHTCPKLNYCEWTSWPVLNDDYGSAWGLEADLQKANHNQPAKEGV